MYIHTKYNFVGDLQINSADLAKLLGSAAFGSNEGAPVGPLTAAVQASGIQLTPRYHISLPFTIYSVVFLTNSFQTAQ
jgi:hypothetical protein